MIKETLVVEARQNGIVLITLNRPQRLNAITGAMLDRFAEIASQLNADVTTRVVVLTGAGRSFCAGRDRNELQDVSEQDRNLAVPKSGGHHSDMVRALQMPTIAAVNGAAVGAGLGFVLQCDVRIASTEALFRDGHLAAGISPSVATWYLPRLIGLGPALQVFCQLDRIDASSAGRMGIVSEVVAPDALLPRALEIAEQFARWDPEVLRHTKALAAAALEQGYEHTMEKVGLLRGLRARGKAEHSRA
jgi:enoyl-CoA hydratase/carnithine racemase